MRSQMKQSSRVHSELFWPRTVVRKLLNISDKESNFSADTDDETDVDADFESGDEAQEASQRARESRFKPNAENNDTQVDRKDSLPRIRRRKSETFRAQYISTKEIRVRVGTWNVGGKNPPEDLDIDEWIDINDPADIYVIGLQEIVPLNAGNIFGAEDKRPVSLWEDVIRDSLNRVRPKISKIKSFSDPPSPTKFKPFEDLPDIQEEILLSSDSDIDEQIHDIDEEVHPFNDVKESTDVFDKEELLRRFSSSPKRMVKLNCLREVEDDDDEDTLGDQASDRIGQPVAKLTRMLSGSERLGLSWPERPLSLLPQNGMDIPVSLEPVRSLAASKSLKSFKSFTSYANDVASEMAFFAEVNLESLIKRRRRVPYVRIVSKQMVGVFLTVWVRRNLRRHIQNLKVSTVGVGVMGYIGNKGSISVSMSIYQTLFCFICTHLTSGEKEVEKLKRNADVQMIYRRTLFHSLSGLGLPQGIRDHERMIWLGDLNYRLNLSYEKARDLISQKRWSELFESDQLIRELKRGRAFDGWSEGRVNFPPTYKYEINSDRYIRDDSKAGRRTPAWCDRILSSGRGMKQVSYKRAELRISDHRPVSATYMVEVEIFSPRRLQRALTFTDAEIENNHVLTDIGSEAGITCLTLEQDYSNWEN